MGLTASKHALMQLGLYIRSLSLMPQAILCWFLILRAITYKMLAMCQTLIHTISSDHLTCLLRNLYGGQEATVRTGHGTTRTGHGTTDWFQIGKGVHQGCTLSPCLFNLYAEYIMGNSGLDEAQAGIKIAGRNINNLRYADDTTLMEGSVEELKRLLMKVKEEIEIVGLKLNIQKTKIMASGPITSWEIDGETVETVSDYFGGLQNHCRW